MTVTLHHGDLPADVTFGDTVAIDTETLGLKPHRDRLCLVQLSAGDSTVHLVKFEKNSYNAPNLQKLLADPQVTKLFHFGRFDIAIMQQYLGVTAAPVYCTKIASKLTRTFTNFHGLKNLCKDLLSVELDKQQQTTDWGADELTPEQMDYAASDVLYLHKLRDALNGMLAREGRTEMAQACFDFLPTRAVLDLKGWAEEDIFSH
ncbi:MAG TPA: ribonuclease D [Alphaproteobacteria bacterium]|nr:ribonuclease D [Alphaproteobacteria bacterium]